MTEKTPAEAIADEQARLNDAQPLVMTPTAEERLRAATDDERRALDPLPRPAMTMRKAPERALGAILLLATVGSLLYMALEGRLGELKQHAVLVMPVAVLAVAYGGLLCLPIPIAAELVGLHKRHGERIRTRRTYALLIPKHGGDAVLVPVRAPVFRAMTPPGIYEARGSASVRVPKWIPAGARLIVYNQSNPEPVNDQSIRGFTSEHVHNMTGGPTVNLVTAAWAGALRLAGVDRRKVFLFVAGVALLWLGYQWYEGRFGSVF